jgi:hypothetical protein
MVGSFNGAGDYFKKRRQAAQPARLPWARRSRPEASGRRLQLLGEEEGEGVFLPLYVFESGRRKAGGRQRGGGLLGPEVEWACCCGGEIKEE